MTRGCPLRLSARCLFLLAFFVFTVSFTVAQSTTATLSGHVTDQADAVIPGAMVTVVNTNTGARRQTTTTDQGYFTVPLLPPSAYIVNVQQQGFAPVEVRDVILNVGDQKALQIQLRAGDVSAMVQVVGEVPLLNESPSVSTTVNRQFVERLPLNGRSFQSLINLSPGVVQTASGNGNSGQFSVNGQRQDANYFTVDGVSANVGVNAGGGLNQTASGALPAFTASGTTANLVSVDALQEFKIQTSTYAPEFGRQPGGQIQIITRSGTNEFRGTLFEYFRNDALDATDWFVNANRLAKPALRQNQFGGVFGGPLYLPRFGEGGPSFVSGKNRTFFFFSYEGLRLRLPQANTVDVPSLSARASAPAGIRPLLNAYPLPNGAVNPATNFAAFSASYSDPSTSGSTSFRIDHNVKDKLFIFGRYSYTTSDTSLRGFFQSLNTFNLVKGKTQTLTVGATWIFSPEINNEFRANWSRAEGGTINYSDTFGGAIPLTDAIFPSTFSSESSTFVLSLSGGTNTTQPIGATSDNVLRQLNLVNNFSFSTGSHQLRLGVDYRRITSFSGIAAYNQIAVFNGVNGALTGRVSSLTVRAMQPLGLVIDNFSAYGQDTWKVSKKLSLTYGLRWELNPPPKGDGLPLYSAQGFENPTTISLAPAGTPLYKTTYNNFAPRIGFAYRLSQHQGRESMFRGGFGIFYDLGSQTAGSSASTFPYVTTKSLVNVPYPLDAAIAAPIPFSINPSGSTINAFDPNLKLPRTYQWNLTFEQSLGTNQTFSAAYVGALGRRLLRDDRLTNPNPSFSRVEILRGNGKSDYHSLQLQLQRHLSRGLQALASYTWAKSIDTASNDNGDLDQARGPSVFDVRHSFSAAATYDIRLRKNNSFAIALFSGWSVDGIVIARSATPVNLVARSIVLIGGVSQNIRPDLITGVPIYLEDPLAPGGKRFNPVAFAIPPVGRQGSLGRNALRGFPLWQTNMTLRRQFDFTERFKLQLRAEMFNIFNHPNFANPVNTLTSVSFGRSTQLFGRSLGTSGTDGGLNPLYQNGGPRSIQLVIRFQF